MKTFLFALALFLSPVALACDCAPVPDETAFQNARAVFLARITNAELVSGKRQTVRAIFEVVEIFKGNPASIKFVESFTPDSSCGEPLIVGARYLIFAESELSAFIVTCGHSRYFNETRETQWLRKHRPAK